MQLSNDRESESNILCVHVNPCLLKIQYCQITNFMHLILSNDYGNYQVKYHAIIMCQKIHCTHEKVP